MCFAILLTEIYDVFRYLKTCHSTWNIGFPSSWNIWFTSPYMMSVSILLHETCDVLRYLKKTCPSSWNIGCPPPWNIFLLAWNLCPSLPKKTWASPCNLWFHSAWNIWFLSAFYCMKYVLSLSEENMRIIMKYMISFNMKYMISFTMKYMILFGILLHEICSSLSEKNKTCRLLWNIWFPSPRNM